eukprot:4961277-Pleurochrysis_carterae.AAC.2
MRRVCGRVAVARARGVARLWAGRALSRRFGGRDEGRHRHVPFAVGQREHPQLARHLRTTASREGRSVWSEAARAALVGETNRPKRRDFPQARTSGSVQLFTQVFLETGVTTQRSDSLWWFTGSRVAEKQVHLDLYPLCVGVISSVSFAHLRLPTKIRGTF